MVGALAAVTAVALVLDATVGLPGGVLHGRLLDGSSPTASASSSPSQPPTAEPAPSVLPAVASTSEPDPADVAAVLDPILDDPAIGARLGAAVIDVRTGTQLYGDNQTTGRPPASTVKLLTAAATLEHLGPTARLTTKVVGSATTDSSGSRPPRITLVGGGDPSLTRTSSGGSASLRTLAGRTARALAQDGVHKVRLAFDDSLFRGPTASPAWPETYLTTGVVAPVTALSVGLARTPDPSLEAALVFAQELYRAGLTVQGAPRRVQVDADTEVVAEVRSQPVSALLEHMLTDSDNDYAEAFGHLAAAAAGEPATFAGAASVTLDALRGLGLPTRGVTLKDASGLARSDRVPAQTLVLTLALAGSHGHPELSSMLSGLAVGGFSGTLADRFTDPSTERAAGFVRAKTGTLTGIAALAGTVQDRDGQVLAFAFMVDRTAEGDALEAPAVFDRAATALARCGCG